MSTLPNLTQKDFDWKLQQLRAYCPKKNHRYHAQLGPALELSTCIAGRQLLEFLGIKVKWQNSIPLLSSHVSPDTRTPLDVHVSHYKELGVSVYPLPSSDSEEHRILANFLLRAHRIAHLTSHEAEDRNEATCPGAELVDKIFHEHFYDKVLHHIPVN